MDSAGPKAVTTPAQVGAPVLDGDEPNIAPVDWVAPQVVLGAEATGFTPWLAKHLEVVGQALGIEDLELVATEVDVAGKRLDILAATAPDEEDASIGLAIEAQYGESDHDHLGKLVTYVAGSAPNYDRVLGVWLVDQVHSAHAAAIEMLNRETSDRLGFVLGRIRFVSTGPQEWAIDVDVVSQPNAFLRAQRKKTQRSNNPERQQFLTEVMAQVRPAILEAGFSAVSSGSNGYSANISWPRDSRWRINVRAGDPMDGFRAMVYVNGEDTTEKNELVLAELAAHKDVVEAELKPYASLFD